MRDDRGEGSSTVVGPEDTLAPVASMDDQELDSVVEDDVLDDDLAAVSYTHLTLPTILLV